MGALWLCLFIPFSAAALDPNKVLHQYNCQTWFQQHGLPANGINAIAQTEDGYLWLGASVGLVRFDGIKFTVEGMAQSRGLCTTEIRSLAAAAGGGLWFGLKQSAYGFYDGHGNWTLGKTAKGGMDWDVPFILESKDRRLWIGGDQRSVRFPDSRLEPLFADLSSPPYINCFLEDARGRIWAGTTGQGLYCFEQGKWTKFPDSALDPNIITALAEDQSGQLWIGTQSGLVCYDSSGHRKAMDAPSYQIGALLADRHGVLWAGTMGGGLWRYANGQWSSLKKTDGLADDYVLSLAEDREGNIWIGTRGGLSQLTDVKFPTFGITEGLNAETVLSVSASPRGGLWVSTHLGASYFDGQTFAETYATNSGLDTPYVKRVLEARNGEVFVLNGSKEINVFAGGKLVARHPTPGMPVALVEDARGVVVSVAGDLFRVGRDYLTPYSFTNGLKPDLYWVLNLAVGRDGSLLVAGANGICRIKDGAFEQWTKNDGLGDYISHWVCEDSAGTLWAGLATGIARIRGREIRNIRREDGLFDAYIYAIVPDDGGNFWVDSNRGIFRVSRTSLNDFADGKTRQVACVSYDSPASVRPADKYDQEQSGCRTLDGRIWFPGSRGMIQIDPARVPINTLPPPVHVANIRANGHAAGVTNGIIVPPGRGELEFQYTALSYIAPQDIQFRYQLEGYDQQWVEAGSRRLAAYNNLQPGRYTFRVVACNADNVWSTTGAAIEIQLRAHFYQAGWFKVFMGALLVVALSGLYGWRVRHLNWKQKQLRQTNELLETKVQARTVELAASNTLLKNEIEERKRMQLEIETIHRQLLDASRAAGQAEVASNVLHNVGNVLNSVNVSTSILKNRLNKMRSSNLEKAVQMILEHAGDLGAYFTTDPKGRRLPRYLDELSRHLNSEYDYLAGELNGLAQNVEHINEIVAMQQSLAKMAGLLEKIPPAEVVENALKLNAASLQRHTVKVVREFEAVDFLIVDKHRLLQILVNLVKNAKHACDENGRPDKTITVRIKRHGPDRVRFEIADTGIGIPAENLTRIFSHGFTTRKEGHGFGLHSSALAAREMEGTIAVHSDGVGQGATFILELPVQPASRDTLIEAVLTA